MKHKFVGFLCGLVLFLVGAALLLAGWLYTSHQHVLGQAETLAASGNFAEALTTYQDAEAHYTTTFWGIPRRPMMDLFGQLGFASRSYIQLRRAEMAFREGERTLALYGRGQSDAMETAAQQGLNDAEAGRPALAEILDHFKAAEAQYKQTQDQSHDPYWEFLANANRARAILQTFLIQAFVDEEQRDPLSLKQGLVQAIQSLQSALDALYTDQVRVSFKEERSLVLLLESLTRFQRTPEVEADERRREEKFFQDTLTDPDIASFGEILRAPDMRSLSLAEQGTTREFLLNQPPENAVRERTERESKGARTDQGSADVGSEGNIH